MSEKPNILIIGGSESDREKLLDELFESMNVMKRSDLYFKISSTHHAWNDLRLTSLVSYT